jgi:hypothetical protein
MESHRKPIRLGGVTPATGWLAALPARPRMAPLRPAPRQTIVRSSPRPPRSYARQGQRRRRLAVRWPKAVQPYITAMTLTVSPDMIACNEAPAPSARHGAAPGSPTVSG